MAKNAAKEPEGKVCIAQIGAPNGVRGDVRVKLFSDDPDNLKAYGPLHSADGSRSFKALSARPQKTVFIVRFAEITSRNDAESLNGTKLYIDRDKLPELEEEEFYHSDLMGLRAELEDGSDFGTVLAVHDFGAGELLDVAPKSGKSILLPFTKEVVPTIDIANSKVVIVLPEGFLDGDDAAEKRKEGQAADLSHLSDELKADQN
ncbi:MAG TPA: 16S rRNA processing protein RimM [Rhizobiales bacterium]|nr:16S rRNA processing protein RimM [Hyphomicrobiales bacterium]